MALYVDGKRVGSRTDTTTGQAYTGYWRVGGDNLGGWPNQPTSNYFAGTIDEVAIYPTALTARPGGRSTTWPAVATPPCRTAPADAYGAASTTATRTSTGGSTRPAAPIAADTTARPAYAGTYNGGVTLGGDRRRRRQRRQVGGLQRVRPVRSSTSGAGEQPDHVLRGAVVQDHHHAGRQADRLRQHPARACPAATTGTSTCRTTVGSCFGTYTGQLNTITIAASATTTTSGTTWSATQGADGMKLYVDGALVGTNPQTQAAGLHRLLAGRWRHHLGLHQQLLRRHASTRSRSTPRTLTADRDRRPLRQAVAASWRTWLRRPPSPPR